MRSTIDQCSPGGRPGEAISEPVQGSLTVLGSDETEAKELSREQRKHISNRGDVDNKMLKKKLVPLLFR
jgi:hypothetical protein